MHHGLRRSVLLLALSAGACVGPPARQSAPSTGSPFRSSQTKPTCPDRAPLAPLAREPQRLKQQAGYFLQLQGGMAPDKSKLLGSAGQPVAAGIRDLRAGALPHLALELAVGQRVEIETRALSQGADTVLHLWSPEQQREVARDDDGGSEPGASRIRFTATAAGTHVLLLRAYSGADDGLCDLLVDGTVRFEQVKFGGAGVLVSGGVTLQSVLLNDGEGQEPWPPSPRAALDTLLLLLDPATGALAALDDDSGVELGSRLQVAAETGRVVVGAFRGADEGTARLAVNDLAAGDGDGDGLGDGLERALCLCSRGDDVACGFDCKAAVSPQDSDGDGLSDAVELLGLDDEQFPQLLPRWGADPRHKDLFVEIDLADWTDVDARPPVRHFGRTLTAQDAHVAARVFARLTAMDNPAGEQGIRLHLDLGQRCGSLASGIDGVCGDLCAVGRDGLRRCGQSHFPGPPAFRRDGLAPARRHLFHVAVSDCLVAGQAPGGAADHLEFDCDRVTAMVHELGHNLGLARHYGTPETGGGNCKPSYPSLMNYAYSDRFHGGREVQFSNGSLVGAGDLDPRNLDETRPYGGDDADVGWLATRPFYFDLQCKAPGVGCMVDWNRDGKLDPSVRAFLSPIPNYGWICENLHGNVLDTENVEGLSVSFGPAAAELRRVHPAGGLAPAMHVVAPAVAGSGATLHLNHSFAASDGWQGWTQILGPPLRPDAQPAAVTIPSGQGAELLWIFGCTGGASPIHGATVDQEGAVTALTAVPGQPGWLRARDVSVTRDGNDILLLVRDDSPGGGDRVYLTRHTPAGWSGSFVDVVAEGEPLRSTVTPALAVGPDGRIYVVTGDPDPPPGTGPVGRLHLYSTRGLPELEDEELWGVRFEDGVPGAEHVTWSRPAMAFVPHLDGEGQPLGEGRGYLAIWWSRGTRMRHLWTWGQLSAQGAKFSLGRWHHYEAMGYTDAIAGSGPALALRGGQRLAAFIGQADRFPRLVRHIPYADGIPDGELVLRDFDDRVPIRQSLCAGLNWDCPGRCKRLTDSCDAAKNVAAPTGAPEVPCALPRWEP